MKFLNSAVLQIFLSKEPDAIYSPVELNLHVKTSPYKIINTKHIFKFNLVTLCPVNCIIGLLNEEVLGT
jgi:hypothetical protein